MVNLAPPPKSWTDAIARIADQFQNARVCFYEADGTGDLDVLDGSGTPGGIRLLWVGRARVQQLRTPQAFATDYEVSSTRNFRFQVSKEAGLPFLSQGVKARVLDARVPGAVEDVMGGGDIDLERLLFVVNSAVNGSHYAVKTIETQSNMKDAQWSWLVDDDGEVVYA